MRTMTSVLLFAAVASGAIAQDGPEIPRFSSAPPGGLPPGWEQGHLTSFKTETEYKLVTEDGAVVLKATAHNAASFLGTHADFDPHRFSSLSWRWKVMQPIAGADTTDRRREDAPARIMVSFDGDKSKLPLKDRAAASAAQSISGQPLPYAQLMYIWGSKVAVDSITTSALTSRIRMLAVAADDNGIGKWQSYTRNLVEDFKRAPGKVIAITLMTDTDNTNGDAVTFYGDIEVRAAAKP